jgi:hypothetical protein
VLCEDSKQAVAVKSQLQLLARPMYSNPPLHGALVVSTVLGDPELKKLWLQEVKVNCYYFLKTESPLSSFYCPPLQAFSFSLENFMLKRPYIMLQYAIFLRLRCRIYLIHILPLSHIMCLFIRLRN